MLSPKQIKFRNDFLSPIKQKLYYLKSLPMGLISGIKLIQLDEEISVAQAPYRWRNKNPFNSMYFAVQSMAAELSTAAPILLSLKGMDASIALIIVDLKVEFVKKAQSNITFTCFDYKKINKAITQLKNSGDITTIIAKTIGNDTDGNEVATFYFTWSLKRR
jgi:hypothetical protein